MEQVFFKNIQHTIVSELQEAQQSIQIAVCWFTNKAIFDILAQKASQGVSLSLVLLDDYANKRQEGLPLNDLIDHSILLIGSYDWTYFSENKALDNLMIIKENQAIIDAFVGEFAMLTSVLSPVSAVIPYTLSEGLVNDVFGLKGYLAEDVYLQAIKADENGEDLHALNLMHHSAQIDKHKAEVQSEFIKEKATEKEEVVEEETPVVYTSRGLGSISMPEPQEEVIEEMPPQETENLPLSLPAFNPEVESLIQQGEAAYQQNKFDEAVQIFSQAIMLQAENPKAYLNMAIVKWRQGKFGEQAEYATQSIQYDATNNKAFNTLALAQDKMGNTLEAINNYTKALALSPDNYSYLWNRAVALKVSGRRQEAILDFGKVIKLCNQVIMSQPNHQNAKMTLAAAMKEVGT
jgi:tetratricopeptide (TPR) repeat protein